MKLKNDFVTNSSSASFIISNTKINEDLGKMKIIMEINLQDFLESTSKYERFANIKNILDYYNGYYPGDFDKMKKIIEKGGEIIIADLESNSRNLIENYILTTGLKCVKFKNKNIKKIRDIIGRY
jgi:hypothetical protein